MRIPETSCVLGTGTGPGGSRSAVGNNILHTNDVSLAVRGRCGLFPAVPGAGGAEEGWNQRRHTASVVVPVWGCCPESPDGAMDLCTGLDKDRGHSSILNAVKAKHQLVPPCAG